MAMMISMMSSMTLGILPITCGRLGRSSWTCWTTSVSRGGSGGGTVGLPRLGGTGGGDADLVDVALRTVTLSTNFQGINCRILLGGGDGGRVVLDGGGFTSTCSSSTAPGMTWIRGRRGRAPPCPWSACWTSSWTITTESMRLWRLMNFFAVLLESIVEHELRIVAIEYWQIRCSFCLV